MHGIRCGSIVQAAALHDNCCYQTDAEGRRFQVPMMSYKLLHKGSMPHHDYRARMCMLQGALVHAYLSMISFSDSV